MGKLNDMDGYFFNTVRTRLFAGKLTQRQVDGMNIIASEMSRASIIDLRWKAYILATAYHETGRAMWPVREVGRGKGRDYGKQLKMSRVPYSFPDRIYYGRGHVQLTWYENYELMGRILGIDLLHNPDLALDPWISAKIMVEGMIRGSSSFGDFTGRCLEQYFTDTKSDWVNARRIVNGTDQAETIASQALVFYDALRG